VKAGLLRGTCAAALPVVLLVATLAAGCGTPSVGTPVQIVRKTIDAQGRLKSATISVDTDIELQVPGGNRSSSLSYKGTFEAPDRWSLTVRASGAKSDVIIIGSHTWVKLPGSDTWTEKKNLTPLTGSPPDDVVASKYLKSAKNVQLVDQKDGTYHLKFDLDVLSFARSFNLPGVDPTLFKGKQAHMEIWVRKDNLFLEKATMNFAGHIGAPINANLKMGSEIDFSDFNEPVSIEPPI
jgi:hypothetical protein